MPDKTINQNRIEQSDDENIPLQESHQISLVMGCLHVLKSPASVHYTFVCQSYESKDADRRLEEE